MKFLLMASCLTFSISIFSQTMEVHYEPNAEKNCRMEVQKIGCPVPTENNEEIFFNCINQKIAKLSEVCRKMHKAMSAARKHNH